MLETIAHSAAFGFGGSIGRDIYKGLKKGNILLIAIVSIGLVIFGYRELVRGHERGFLQRSL